MWQLSSIQLLYSERMSFIIPTYIFQDPSSIICVRHLRPIHRSLSLNAFTTLVHGMICTQMDSFGMLFTSASLPPELLSPNNNYTINTFARLTGFIPKFGHISGFILD